MKNIKSNIYIFKTLALALALFLSSCEEEAVVDPSNPPAAVSFDMESDSFVVVDDESAYDITVQFTKTSNVDRTVSFMINEDATTASSDQYSVGNQVVVPAGSLIGTTTLDFNYDELDFGDSRVLSLDLVLGENDTPNITRQSFDLTFVKECTLNNVVLSIDTDDYPEETTWELYDFAVSTTVPVQTGGPFDGQANVIIDIPLCLDAGSYGIIVRDSYGDGIAPGGFSVSLDGTVIASGVVGPSASPGSQPSFGSATFDL